MELVQLSPAQLFVLYSIIVGITELINRLRARDLWVAATIVTAALVGGFVAAYYKLDFLTGVVAGLGASGTIKTLGSIGNKSTPAPSTILEPKV